VFKFFVFILGFFYDEKVPSIDITFAHIWGWKNV